MSWVSLQEENRSSATKIINIFFLIIILFFGYTNQGLNSLEAVRKVQNIIFQKFKSNIFKFLFYWKSAVLVPVVGAICKSPSWISLWKAPMNKPFRTVPIFGCPIITPYTECRDWLFYPPLTNCINRIYIIIEKK